MCDCYSEPCKCCGEVVPLHLGDYETGRFEIFVVCEKCLENPYLGEIPFPSVLWKYDSEEGKKEMLIVSVTKNAWENREKNHPNVYKSEKVREYKNKFALTR